jgi:hypothetical protein
MVLILRKEVKVSELRRRREENEELLVRLSMLGGERQGT